MGCCNQSEAENNKALKWNSTWLVNVCFVLAKLLFHSFYARSSESRHQNVMKLFQLCADREHIEACSLYGHLLLFRGSTKFNKMQGVKYLNVAANGSEVKACYQMALIMKNEEYGFPNDSNKVIGLLLTAVKGGNVLAAKELLAFLSENDLMDQVSSDQLNEIQQSASLSSIAVQ